MQAHIDLLAGPDGQPRGCRDEPLGLVEVEAPQEVAEAAVRAETLVQELRSEKVPGTASGV